MYCRARWFSGVPIGRDPMVPASICTCARAFSTEKRGACRAQAPRQMRRKLSPVRRIPDRLADRGAARGVGADSPFARALLYANVAAEGLEVVMVVPGAEIGGKMAPARGVHLHGLIAVQRAAEAVEVDMAAGGVRQPHRDVSAECLRIDRRPRARHIHFAGEGPDPP